jgi:hypothetical protein
MLLQNVLHDWVCVSNDKQNTTAKILSFIVEKAHHKLDNSNFLQIYLMIQKSYQLGVWH